ncbi:hypothetical protein [Mycobacterium avium]|uniref:hypothetical protein n=1 Tax=Mycobacterium avium TaxID=1764 RepID=UPI0015CC6F15|nr:hypothetical protein [Mycobacterium avium]
MGAIQPIDLPESTLIIGTNFPTQDETAYAREANAQRIAAEHAAGAGAVAYDSARYTNEAFQGEAGGSLAATLTRHHQTLSADQARHSNVASWLELGAQNIIHTKTAMNQISSDYHNAYEQMCQRAQAETWPQRLLSNGKDELVTESQNRVRAARAAFEDRHREVSDGINRGDAPRVAAAGYQTRAGGQKDAPASPLDASTLKPGQKHRPYIAGPGQYGPPNYPDRPPWVDVYDRTQDPDTVPHTFIPSDEIPHYQQLEPGALGPSTKADGHGNPDPYIELAPNSGVWVPKSDFPGAKFYPPGGHGELPPYGWDEYIPGSGIYLWQQDLLPGTYHSGANDLPPATHPQGGH